MRKSARTQIPPFFDNDPYSLQLSRKCNSFSTSQVLQAVQIYPFLGIFIYLPPSIASLLALIRNLLTMALSITF